MNARASISIDDLEGEQVDDALRGEVMVGVAQTLWALSNDSCPEVGSDQNRIDAWHSLLYRLSAAARYALILTGWSAGEAVIAAVCDHIDAKEDVDWEEDVDASQVWFAGFNRRAELLLEAAQTHWPEVTYPDEDDE